MMMKQLGSLPVSIGIVLSVMCAAVQAQPLPSAAKLPAVLEPYAGYDVVFGPSGPRVLGPDAAEMVEAMITKPTKDLGSDGCKVGDIQLQVHAITVMVQCGDRTLRVELRSRLSQPQDARPLAVGQIATTALFAVQIDALWRAECDPACTTAKQLAQLELLARIKAKEATIPWMRVRPPPGTAQSGVLAALIDAQAVLAIGDREAARRHLATARAALPDASWSPIQCFDYALLATEGGDAANASWATKCVQDTVGRAVGVANGDMSGPDSGQLQGIAAALPALLGDPAATLGHASTCSKSANCDILPSIRALAATRSFAFAAKVLDEGPLAKVATHSTDLLKLRFGMASALGDAAGEMATAIKIQEFRPDAPEGVDLLAAGLARAGRWREAIEKLHDLSKKHPERDIVLGRIAGMINFLTHAAGLDMARKADLDAIEERMRLAARDPADIVARFIVATRAYYAGKLDEAVPLLAELNKSNNRDPRLPLYLAMAHFWLGHQQQAQLIIQRAVEIGPSDPDVFYCRSQIVRSVNLPLAIRDLERYEGMTKQPWSIGPAQKSARVEAELQFMRKGELPPDWDRPGPQRVAFLPQAQTGTVVAEDVRSGRNWLPGAATPSDAATVATSTASAVVAATGATAATAANGAAPSQPEDPAPWWPLAALTAVAAALLARVWGRDKA
ncbi:MAG: tetratricopeptide repeat protein [Myxococcales bacterium]|nr:tetratricopeptide repeat protein [Myxococcales bacterium]